MSMTLLGCGGGRVVVTSIDPYLMGQDARAASTSHQLTLSQAAAVGDLVTLMTVADGGNPSGCTDSAGNTWDGGPLISSDDQRIQFLYAVLTAPLTTSDTITVTYGTSRTMDMIATCFPAGIAFDKVTNGGGAGSLTGSPAQTTDALSSQPQYVQFGIWVRDGFGTMTPPGGFTSVGSTSGGAYGNLRTYWQRVTSTSAVSFTSTGYNAPWGMQALTMTTS